MPMVLQSPLYHIHPSFFERSLLCFPFAFILSTDVRMSRVILCESTLNAPEQASFKYLDKNTCTSELKGSSRPGFGKGEGGEDWGHAVHIFHAINLPGCHRMLRQIVLAFIGERYRWSHQSSYISVDRSRGRCT